MKRLNDVQLSRYISFILRHKPEEINCLLEQDGWLSTLHLISGIIEQGTFIDYEILERIVTSDTKQRYSFNEDKSKIRANQGHSVKVNINMKEKIPPNVLYHGTAYRFVDSIKENGICKLSRLFVHLSSDFETAVKVGTRHGKPVVLSIDSKQMHRDGFKFFLSENGVWQVERVPYVYIRALSSVG